MFYLVICFNHQKMRSRTDLAEVIDAFLNQPKRLAGVDAPSQWQQGWDGRERIIVLPIEIDGESVDYKIHIASLINYQADQFRIGLMAPFCVSRLDFTTETHENTLAIPDDSLPLIVRGPHYHSWDLNRRFFKGVSEPPRLRNARQFTPAQRSFDSILRWFLGEHGIDSLPANHAIRLPQRDWLF